MFDFKEMKYSRLLPIAALLICSSLVIYGRTIAYDFLSTWDDAVYMTANKAIQGLNYHNISTAFRKYYLGNYSPLHIISYMIDYDIWGLRPAGFHIDNILIHAANGILFYIILARFYTGTKTALLAALFFVIHPIQVESVAWLSERKNILSLLFFLLAWHQFLLFRERGCRRRLPYLLSILFFVLALLTKSVTVILPAVLLVHDLLFEKDISLKRKVKSVLPFVAMAAAACVVALISQAPESGGGRSEFHGGTFSSNLYTTLPVVFLYLKNLLWPVQLSALYEVPTRTAIDGTVVAAGLALAAYAVAAAAAARRHPQVCFWMVVVAVAFLPVSQIVPINTLINDRYAYFPMLGLSVLAATAVVSAMDSRKAALRAAGLGLALLTLPLSYVSFQRCAVWNNSLTLWNDARKKAPGNSLVWSGFGVAYQQMGNLNSAIAAFQKAVYVDPDNILALVNLALIHCHFGQLDIAGQYLDRLVARAPLDPTTQVALGNFHYLKGEKDLAEQAFSKALQQDPTQELAYVMIATIRMDKGEYASARDYIQKALQQTGEPFVEAEYSLACLESRLQNPKEAFHHLEKALQLGFNDFQQLRKDAALKPLLDTPEFQALLRRYQSGSKLGPSLPASSPGG